MINTFLKYTQLADQKLIEIFELNVQQDMPEIERLFSHILNAQHIWAKRILGEEIQFEAWEVHKKEDFREISAHNFELITAALSLAKPEDIIVYKTSNGREYSNSVGDMILQALNHSTYHRGQIMTMLKKEGIKPPATDYILFKRENLL